MHSEPLPAAAAAEAPGLEDRDLQLLWYRLATRRWRALAIVAPGRGELASRLMDRLLGTLGGPSPRVRGVDAARATPGRIAALCRVLERGGGRDGGERVLVAAPDPAAMPEAQDLVSACDGTLLVLLKEESRLDEVERTLARVGRGRVLGAVLAHRLQAS